MKFIFTLFVLFILFSCENKYDKKATLAYFDKEIAHRMEVLTPLVISGDTLRSKISLIDNEVANLILLSKDGENISASVNRANSFFDALAAEFRLQIKDFTKLNTGMHVDEIELVLKQNELNLFNQIVFKSTGAKNTMYTAQ
jgi:hypothetical protein